MRRIFQLIFLAILMLVLTYSTAFPKKRRPHPIKRKKQIRNSKQNNIIHNRITKKRHFIKAHDLNRDGTVNYLDKIMWINTHPVIQETVVITANNSNLLEDIDLNADGNIDQGEIDVWFSNYDANKDGIIIETELNL